MTDGSPSDPPDDIPAWSHGSYLWLGDAVSSSGYKIDPQDGLIDTEASAQEAAGIIRAFYSDILGREISGRAPSLLRKYETEAGEFEAAVRAAHADGMTLGEWVLRAVKKELAGDE